MKPDIDFSKATAEHYKIDNPDMRLIQTTEKSVPEIYSLADAKAVFFSLREDETPVTDSAVGIGRSTCMCPKSPEELFFICSSVGHRTQVRIAKKESLEYAGANDYNVMWSGDDIIAHSPLTKFDVEMTRKTADRKLVWSAAPQYVTCKAGTAVAGWGGNDVNDLMLPGEVKSWEAKEVGNRTYFLYPERGVVLGTCRAVSMSIISEHFERFPKFAETVRTTRPKLWETIQNAIEDEKATEESRHWDISGAVLGAIKNPERFHLKVEEKFGEDDTWRASVGSSSAFSDAELTHFKESYALNPDNSKTPFYFLIRDRRTDKKAVVWQGEDNPMSYEASVAFGRSKGVPEAQLDFADKFPIIPLQSAPSQDSALTGLSKAHAANKQGSRAI